MMNFAANDASLPVRGIQAIAFRQKMVDALRRCMKNISNRPVTRPQRSRRTSTIFSAALVPNPSRILRTTHPRKKIRQMKERSRAPHRNRIRRIQTKKPHARLSIPHHISPHIQFRKPRKPRNRRDPSHPHTRHAKWRHAQPRLPVKCIYLQPPRNHRTQCLHRHRPVREQQMVPLLLHDPQTARQRPRPVGRVLKNFYHQNPSNPVKPAARHLAALNIPFLNRPESNL